MQGDADLLASGTRYRPPRWGNLISAAASHGAARRRMAAGAPGMLALRAPRERM